MPEPTLDQIDSFISLFDGDVEAAKRSLTKRQQQIETLNNLSSSKQHQNIGETPIISLKNVTKKYKVGKNRVEALKSASLDIYKGEFVAITGASGSGKSTLLQIIGCLDTPSEGEVVVDGQNTGRLSDIKLSNLRQSSIGFIFQSFYLQPFLRLDNNVGVPAMFAGKKLRDIKDETETYLQQVGLDDRARHYPKELSGGQIQRAAIARALINKPKIILADEPTGNLDSTNSESIVQLFKDIRDQLGTTVVVVTHNPEIAAKADRVISMRDGVLL